MKLMKMAESLTLKSLTLAVILVMTKQFYETLRICALSLGKGASVNRESIL